MRKSFFLKFIYAAIACGAWPPFSLASAPAFAAGAPQKEVEKLRQLTESIDSLEVERQMKRRDGLPLGEIESSAARLRDSLNALQLKLRQAGAKAPASQSPKTATPLHFLSQSHSLPDWIVIGAGGVTICAGIAVCFIYLGSLARRRKRTIQPARGNVRQQVVAAYRAAGPPQPRTPARRATKPGTIPPAKPEPAVPEPAKPPVPVPHLSPTELKTANDLIIAAYQEGMSIPEISKRYHVSADHAALIVKMAKQTRRQ